MHTHLQFWSWGPGVPLRPRHTFFWVLTRAVSFAQITEVDDIVYEADCQTITLRAGNVDIGANA